MLKYIIGIIIVMTAFISTSAQDFYYRVDKKIPIEPYNRMKVIYCEDTEATPLPPGKGDSITKVWRDEGKCMVIYQEAKSEGKVQLLSSSNPDSLCIYDCFSIGSSNAMLVPTGTIGIKLKSDADTTLLKKVCEEYNCVILKRSTYDPNWYKIEMIPGVGRNPILLANTIYETGCFLWVYPQFSSGSLEQISYDPKTETQWGLYNQSAPHLDISVSTAWNYATGRNIKIAIIDSGTDIYHEDLFQRIYTSYDVQTGSSPCRTDGWHGTMCAGIAAATRNNDTGIAGVAPDALLMPISIPTGDNSKIIDIADAISWAWVNGADVISCSLGGRYDEWFVEDAIYDAVALGRNGRGCVIVAAAGNIHPDTPNETDIMYPAAYPEVIAVGNMEKSGDISSSSCYGPNMCVVAPGTDIISTTLDNAYKEDTGTSLACPFVAGVAALILQRDPNLTAGEVRDRIVETAQKIGPLNKNNPWNQKYGYGLVNAAEAVRTTPRK